jgi:hypothetical protein
MKNFIYLNSHHRFLLDYSSEGEEESLIGLRNAFLSSADFNNWKSFVNNTINLVGMDVLRLLNNKDEELTYTPVTNASDIIKVLEDIESWKSHVNQAFFLQLNKKYSEKIVYQSLIKNYLLILQE